MTIPFHQYLDILHKISHTIVQQENIETLGETITTEIDKLQLYSYIGLFYLEGDQLILKSSAGELKDTPSIINKIEIGNGVIGESVYYNKPILINNIYASVFFQQEFHLSLQSIYCLPLKINTHTIGAILLGSKNVEAFSTNDVKYLNILASGISIAIHNALNYQILRAHSKISRITTTNLEFEQSYFILIEELQKVVHFDGLKFTFPHYFRDKEISCFPIYLDGKVLPLNKVLIPIDGSATKEVLFSNKIMVSDHANSNFLEDRFQIGSNLVSLFNTALRIPIIHKGEGIGVVHLYSKRQNAYNAWEIETISDLVLQMGPAIGNIIDLYYQNAVKRIKNITYKAANDLIGTSQLEDIFFKYSKLATRYLGLSNFDIWILDQERLVLQLIGSPLNLELAITDNSPIVKSLLSKEIQVFKEPLDLSVLHSSLETATVKSSIIVPLCDHIEKQCVGVVFISDNRSVERFNHRLVEIAGEYLRPLGVHILRRLKNTQLEKANSMMVRALTVALDKKDAETKGHSQRVMDYSLAIAKRLGVKETSQSRIKWGALLHDIGKIGIPDAILLKPAQLTDEEWSVMRTHPTIGYEMVQNIQFLEDAIDIILYHHERYDGKGYPYGLKGENIPLAARIFAIADAFDTITSKRPYKEPKSILEARRIIIEDCGTHFCPNCVEAFLSIPIEELQQIQNHQLESIIF